MQATNPDINFADEITMDIISGFYLTQASADPIIFLSSHAALREVIRRFSGGVHDFIYDMYGPPQVDPVRNYMNLSHGAFNAYSMLNVV